MKSLDENIFSELEEIEWLSSCGMESSLSVEKYLRQVKSPERVDNVYTEEWIDLSRVLDNETRQILSNNYPELFSLWNELVGIARDEISRRVKPKLGTILDRQRMWASYEDFICADLLGYSMEIHYANLGCVLPIFYRNLYTIYRHGHFPCGWGGGKFPNGYQYYY